LLFAAMCVIWGLPYLLIRVAVRDLSPATLVCARTGIAALLLLPVAIKQGHLRMLAGHWTWLVVYTVVELAVPWFLLSSAEQHLTSSLSGLLVAAVPLVGVLLSFVMRSRETFDARRVVGLLIGVAGVAALVGLQLGHLDLVAVAEVAVVAVGYAAGPLVLTRRLSHLPGIAVVAASLTLTALVYLPFAATSVPRHLDAGVIASVAVLAVVCTAVAFLVFFALIAEVGPTRAVVITYVNPAVAIALGVSILGEAMTTGIAIGFPLVLLGSVLATAPRPAGVATTSATESVEHVSTG
jgi:drug/metabolite transporter (DMT)-like permease